MKRKRGDILIALLSLADIIVLINMAQLLPKGAVSIAIYSFDFLVVVLIIFSFCRRMKESGRWKKFLFRNWYEFPGMIPIVVFALAGQCSAIYDRFITVGVMLRVLAITYLIKLSRSLEEKSRERTVDLQVVYNNLSLCTKETYLLKIHEEINYPISGNFGSLIYRLD